MSVALIGGAPPPADVAAQSADGVQTTAPLAQVLTAVSCMAPTSCVAIGYSTAPNTGVVVPISSGVPGAVQTLPGTHLTGIACWSATSCVAVGTGRAAVVVPVTNGVAGALQTVPGASGLSAVACDPGGGCIAAGTGTQANEGVILAVRQGVIGTSSSIPLTSSLTGASCWSVGRCVVVGTPYPLTGGSIIPVTDGNPGTVGHVPQGLDGVGCDANGLCEAVGPNLTVAYQNGTVGAQRSTAFSTLLGVACPLPAACIAVGYSATGVTVPISGTTPATPQPVSGTSALYAIACPQGGGCFAVGGTAQDVGAVVSMSPPSAPGTPPPANLGTLSLPVTDPHKVSSFAYAANGPVGVDVPWSHTFTQTDSTFSLRGALGSGVNAPTPSSGLNLWVTPFDNSTAWMVWMAPSAGQSLHVGTFSNAGVDPNTGTADPTRPVLQVGICNRDATFTITLMDTNAQGVIDELDVTYSARCQENYPTPVTITGSLQFNVPPTGSAPTRPEGTAIPAPHHPAAGGGEVPANAPTRGAAQATTAAGATTPTDQRAGGRGAQTTTPDATTSPGAPSIGAVGEGAGARLVFNGPLPLATRSVHGPMPRPRSALWGAVLVVMTIALGLLVRYRRVISGVARRVAGHRRALHRR